MILKICDKEYYSLKIYLDCSINNPEKDSKFYGLHLAFDIKLRSEGEIKLWNADF